MIGRLRGILAEKQPPSLLVDTNGVFYELQASMNTFYQLPEIGQQVTLHAHLIVREDAQILYGFATLQERALFRILIKVNGVGPKLAITILSSIEPAAFAHCVAMQDSATLVKLPGVGKKTAERLLIELKDRIRDWSQSNAEIATIDLNLPTNASDEATQALIALGYKPNEATRAIAILDTTDLPSEVIIRQVLQQMANA